MKNNKFVQQGKLTKSGWLSIVAFLLVAVLALSVALGLVVKSGKEKKGTEEAYVGGGMVLPEETEGSGISLTSTVIPKEQYGEYGIMPIAETSYSVTATAKAEGGVELSETQQQFNWSLAWASSNSSDVNTYVSLSASEGARTATVSLLQPFSTQILLKCTWAYNDAQSGSVTLDYAKRFKGFKIQYASSVAKSASDESHLSTILLEPDKCGWGVKSFDLYLASPFVDGSWENGPWNATVLRVVEPVFDSVGTLENSVVSYSHDDDSDNFPESETTNFDHISNQMYFCMHDDVNEVFDLTSLRLYAVDGNHPKNSLIPLDTRSFSQLDLLSSCFVGPDLDRDIPQLFGTRTSGPIGGNVLAYDFLSYCNDFGGDTIFYFYFPTVINLQYGDPADFSQCCEVKIHVDLPSASSIDFTQKNFIF